MEKMRQILALSMVKNMGPRAFQNGLMAFGSAEVFFQDSKKRWAGVEGLRKLDWRELESKTLWDKADKEIELAAAKKVKIITFLDKDYPKLLKEIHDPPILLYVWGELPGDSFAHLAMVGSREATRNGLEAAEKISEELALAGAVVVSGLARGIDAASHQGALKTGKTIAVLGSGLSCLYPPEHRKLAEEIGRNGAVISEFPMTMQPIAQNFPRRNRIISGLSHAVIVVEARQKSGALITVDFALEQGRDVYAVPGSGWLDKTRGSNELLKQGARFVTETDDILSDFHLKKTISLSRSPKKKANLEKEEADLLRILKKSESLHLDELVEQSLLTPQKTMTLLTSLSMKGVVKELPGKYFMEVSG